MEISALVPEGVFGCNTYLVSAEENFAVIDASVPLTDLLLKYPACRGKIAYVLLTHAHFDHIRALGSYADAGIPVFLASDDVPLLSDPMLNCSFGGQIAFDLKPELLTDGQTIPFGDRSFSVRLTPGHTAGSAVFRIGDALFTGDTVFADGGYGRCDLPGGDIRSLRRSLALLGGEDPALTVYPGHGGSDRLGRTLSLIF